jgi:hypothetical protein
MLRVVREVLFFICDQFTAQPNNRPWNVKDTKSKVVET